MDIKNIKMLISDVDGVWTDGSFYKGTDNIELKKFSVFDGVGVAMARAAKIEVALISGRFSSATEHRAKELGIEDVYNGCLNKLPAYEELKSKYQLNDTNIAYIGDDVNDFEIMRKVGFSCTPNDGIKKIKDISDYVCTAKGGHGVFREVSDLILKFY